MRPGGRLVIVEPDNAARYWFSEPASGHEAFSRATRFFAALEDDRGGRRRPVDRPARAAPRAGDRLRGARRAPVAGLADAGRRARRPRLGRAARAPSPPRSRSPATTPAADAGRALVTALDRYAREADEAGSAFVEIQTRCSSSPSPRAGPGPAPPFAGGREGPGAVAEGWHGWDDYAAFYDWENARTVGRRDVAFWRGARRAHRGPRRSSSAAAPAACSLPVARAGVPVVGIDRSAPMLARARRRLRRLRTRGARARALVAATSATLPFGRRRLRSRDRAVRHPAVADRARRDLTRTLAAARVLEPGGRFGIDLVPDLPRWREYERRREPRGTGPRAALPIRSSRPSGRTDAAAHDLRSGVHRGWGRARRVHRFSLTFRTIGRAGAAPASRTRRFAVDAVLGDYDGQAWDPRADTWVVLARKL